MDGHVHTSANKRQTPSTPRQQRRYDLCTDINQPQLSDPCTTHHAPLDYAVGSHLQCCACRIRASRFHTFQAADAAPRTARRRKQAVYSTSARTSIRLSSRIHAPHITRRWNTQWDLTSSAVPAGSAPAAFAPLRIQPQTLFSPPGAGSVFHRSNPAAGLIVPLLPNTVDALDDQRHLLLAALDVRPLVALVDTEASLPTSRAQPTPDF